MDKNLLCVGVRVCVFFREFECLPCLLSRHRESVRAYVRSCVRSRVRSCVRACVRVCVSTCVRE